MNYHLTLADKKILQALKNTGGKRFDAAISLNMPIEDYCNTLQRLRVKMGFVGTSGSRKLLHYLEKVKL